MNNTILPEYLVVAGKNEQKKEAAKRGYEQKGLLLAALLSHAKAPSGEEEQPLHRISWLAVHFPTIANLAVSLIPGLDRPINGVNEGKRGAITRARNAGAGFRAEEANAQIVAEEQAGKAVITANGTENYIETRPTWMAPVYKALVWTGLKSQEWYNQMYDADKVEHCFDLAAVALIVGSQEPVVGYSDRVPVPARFVRQAIAEGQKETVGKKLERAGLVRDNANPHPDLDPAGRDRLDFLTPAVGEAIDLAY
jgi:hypothetical protein